MSAEKVVQNLLEQAGTTFAAEAGIKLENKPSQLYRLLVMAVLLSTRIKAGIALSAARELREFGTAQKMRDATWQQRVDALGRGHYVRYDESTATALGNGAQLLLDRYHGDLRKLRAQADGDVDELRELLRSGDLGRPLVLHCAHRNPSSPPGFTSEMMIFDSVVHEFDTTRWLLGEDITAVSVRQQGLEASDDPAIPQIVTMETASGVLVDVEIFVQCRFGYQVRCEAVCEHGTALVGADAGI